MSGSEDDVSEVFLGKGVAATLGVVLDVTGAGSILDSSAGGGVELDEGVELGRRPKPVPIVAASEVNEVGI